MDYKFIMMDVLTTQKMLVVNTAIALNEASCDQIYKAYNDIFNKVTKEQKDLFAFCYNNGWYQLEEAPSTKLTKEIDKFCQELGCE